MRVQVFLCIVVFCVVCLYFISSSSSLRFDWSASANFKSLLRKTLENEDQSGGRLSEMGANGVRLGVDLDRINVDTAPFAGETTEINVNKAHVTASVVETTTSKNKIPTNTSSYTEKSDVSVEQNNSEEAQVTQSIVDASQDNNDNRVSSDGTLMYNESASLKQDNQSKTREQNINNSETTELRTISSVTTESNTNNSEATEFSTKTSNTTESRTSNSESIESSTDLLKKHTNHLEYLRVVTKPPSDDLCPLVPPNLIGPFAVKKEKLSFEEIASQNPGLEPGGLYSPPECKARYRVAIVIPYRKREAHLKALLQNLHPFLMRQQLEYGIYIIDQALPTKFNRALLMNIGFVEAFNRDDYQCVIFHDVDLIPENDKNIYSCPPMPRHMSSAVDKFNYSLPYRGLFGGVTAFTKEQFEKVNGYSNLFFGWGGEDDDMRKRIELTELKIIRYPIAIAHYTMSKHGKEVLNEKNPRRHGLLHFTPQRMKFDGLGTVNEFYTVEDIEELPTHTRIAVEVDDSIYNKKFDYQTGRVIE